MRSNSFLVTGCTERRERRSNVISASSGESLISAKLTTRGKASTKAMSTMNHRGLFRSDPGSWWRLVLSKAKGSG